ncbi:MAG: beta-lactamase family protein [Oscillospiraceae bacterium]|nr:beta-lactamase family protein [Oscillospiraceae bacterium]
MKYKKIIAAAAALAMLAAPASGAHAAETANKPHTASETLFSIGSVSKTFAAAAAMQLADAGKLDPDAPVTDYLPEFRMADSRYRDITVRMLMDHTSGLMGSYYANDVLYGSRSRVPHDAFLSYLSTERLKAAPGAYGCYCNDGYELLEQIVERVSGEDFTAYIEAHICKPLGMEQTGTPWNAFETPEQTKVYSGRASVPADYGMTVGTGGILSTAAELCKFGSAFFKGDCTLLSENAKTEMFRSGAGDQYEDGFGLGFDTVSQPEYAAAGVQVVSKGGDLVEQHAELLVAPDEQISVAVLSAGGSSTENKMLAEALMDIALEEKGVKINHPVIAEQPTADSVPEAYLAKAGLYLDRDSIYALSFPEQKYMQIDKLCTDLPQTRYFLYTGNDSFVQVGGDPAKDSSFQPRSEQTVLRLTERGGETYIAEESRWDYGTLGVLTNTGYSMQKVSEHPVSEAAQAAWDARSGKRYWLAGDTAFSISYLSLPCAQLYSDPAAPGYFGNMQITDENHAKSVLSIPSSMSRDQFDLECKVIDGKEYLICEGRGMTFLSEDSIPDLPADLDCAELTSGAAAWYNISGTSNRTITLDIPDGAAVYVYDRFGNVVYASISEQYGSTAALPLSGKIVFAGETGSTVGIRQ